MLQNIKKALIHSILLLLIFVCSFGFSACLDNIEILHNDLFLYSINKESGEAIICGLTDKGMEQEFLVIPKEINGIKVAEFNGSNLFRTPILKQYADNNNYLIHSEKLKKIYISTDVEIDVKGDLGYSSIFAYCPSLTACIVVPDRDIGEITRPIIELKNTDGLIYLPVYVTKSMAEIDKELNAANVSYYYNYEGAENGGYYWLDNYDYGSKIEYVPQDPIREEYNFGGWYKEPECLTEWDFESDTLPTIKTDGNSKVVYQETKLFAKWIKV